jgi:polysaccharide biosynthesis transport protein
MNEEQSQVTHDRSMLTARFFSRMHRYRNLFRRRWWVLVLCVGLALAVMATYVNYAHTEYVSAGQMIVSMRINIQQGSLYSEDLNNFLGTQVQLMKGSEVQQHAQERVTSQNPGLLSQPVLLDVNVLPRTTIFVLRARGENPQYTKLFLQACMEEYINLKKGMAERASSTTIAGLTDQMLRLEPELQRCDEQIQSFLATNDAAMLQEANGVGTYLAVLYQQLASAQSQYALLQSMTLDQNLLLEQDRSPARLGGDSVGQMASATGGGVLVNAGLAEQSGLFAPNTVGMEYLTIKQHILLLEAQTNRFAKYLKPKHPQMLALNRQLEELAQMLDIYKNQSIEQLDAKKSAMALQITNLENQTKQWGGVNLDLSRKSAQFARLKAKSDRIQGLYDSLLATLQTLDVSKDISPETVTIYNDASDAVPDQTLARKGMPIAAVVGLVLGLVLLLLLDRVDDRLNSFTELEELFDEDVLGQIPRERRPPRGGVLPFIQTDDQRHPFIESYRNLRSSLLFMAETGTRPHTLLVTSSVPNDGKSLTAANLSITLAMGGARVLLVDADLRKGGLSHRFGIDAETGMHEVLADGKDWRSLLKKTNVANLWLLPRGSTTQRSGEFFLGPVMDKFLQDSKKEYDYVIIDTAPVMAADDVTSLAPRVDGVIFVIRAEYTSARVARAALDMLYQRKSRVLGIVFNSVRATGSDYYAYYRYRDYYKAKPGK